MGTISTADGDELTRRQVREVVPLAVALPEEGARHEAQHVDGGHERAEDAERAQDRLGAERADEDHHLRNETAQPRQADRRQARDHERARAPAHARREAVQHQDISCVGPLVDGPDKCEEEGRHDAMGEHLQRGAGHTDGLHRRDAHEHVAHVADAGVPDDVLQVVLRQRRDRPVEHIDGAEDEQHEGEVLHPLRQHHHPDPDDAERAQLHQHARVQHTHRGRRGDVSIGRPRVERPKSRQQAEPDHYEQEHHTLEEVGEGATLLGPRRFAEREDVEGRGSRLDVDRHDDDPHEHAARDDHQDELQRPVLLRAGEILERGAAPPHADEQVHRHDGQLVEEEEKEEVSRDERPVHARNQQEQQDVVVLVLERCLRTRGRHAPARGRLMR